MAHKSWDGYRDGVKVKPALTVTGTYSSNAVRNALFSRLSSEASNGIVAGESLNAGKCAESHEASLATERDGMSCNGGNVTRCYKFEG